MRPIKQTPPNGTAEQHVREIRRQTRKKYSAEENNRPDRQRVAIFQDFGICLDALTQSG